jgi:simple sugar transport system substrate-binding protein
MNEKKISRGDALKAAGVLAGTAALPGLFNGTAAAATRAAGFAAAGTPAANWARGMTIRFFAGGPPGDFFSAIILRGMERAKADIGNPDVQVVFSNWDPAKFIQDLRSAIAAKPDAIMMMGHAGDAAIMPLAKQAAQKGIIMTYANVDVPKVRARYGGGYVGANLAQAGMSLGTKALQTLPLKKGDGALVFGEWGRPGRAAREQGVATVFQKAGLKVTKVVTPESGGSDPNVLTPLVTGALLRNPSIKVVCYSRGPENAGLYMKAAGKHPGQVFNIGFDLSPDIANAINDGWVQLTLDQQPFLQGYLPLLSLALTKKWQFSPIINDTGAGFTTKANLNEILPLVKQGIRETTPGAARRPSAVSQRCFPSPEGHKRTDDTITRTQRRLEGIWQGVRAQGREFPCRQSGNRWLARRQRRGEVNAHQDHLRRPVARLGHLLLQGSGYARLDSSPRASSRYRDRVPG